MVYLNSVFVRLESKINMMKMCILLREVNPLATDCATWCGRVPFFFPENRERRWIGMNEDSTLLSTQSPHSFIHSMMCVNQYLPPMGRNVPVFPHLLEEKETMLDR
jgi:hypothetical protein